MPSKHIEQLVVVVKSRSFGDAFAFYRDVLGLDLVEEWTKDGHGAVFSAGGPARVELIDLPESNDSPPSDAMFIGLQVADIDPIHRRAVEAGHEIVLEPADRPWGGRGIVVRDPNGIPVNVYTAYRAT